MMWIRQLLTAIAIAVVCTVVPAGAQTCNDSRECTNPDMCTDGVCSGTPISGGTCDDNNVCTGPDTCAAGTCTGAPLSGGACNDNNPCTTNDTCASGLCQGMAVANNTPCGTGSTECGLCVSGACVPNGPMQGQPCTDAIGACTQNDVCLGTICLGQFITCPDSDENRCTIEFCNLLSGQCEPIGPLLCGECQTCDMESGQCADANEGVACDDGDVCTPDSLCMAGACIEGIPGGTATATVTFTPTGTPTGTGAATATATVTATGTQTGTAAATATATPIFTATATGTPTGTGAATATVTVTATGTPTGTAATVTATATGTPTGTAAATFTATATPTTTLSGPTPTVTATVPAFTPTVTRTGTATSTPLPVVASIIIGDATGAPGSTVTFTVSLESDDEVAGTQNDITFNANARIRAEDGDPACTVNPAIDKDDSTFAFLPSGCTPGTDCTSVRALILSFANLEPIPDGSALYTCEVEIAATATGSFPLTCSSPGAGAPDGTRLGADCTDGTITVAAPGTATIVIEDVVGAPGDFVPFDVTLQTAVEVARLQNDIAFDPEAPIAADDDDDPLCTVNPAINKEGTTFAFTPSGCTVGTTCTGIRVNVLSLATQDPIPNGATVYTCTVAIAENAADDTYPLTCSNASAQNPEGAEVTTNCVDGSVDVGVQPTPSHSPTATVSGVVTPDTPTVTHTPGSPTVTASVTPPPPPTSTRTSSAPTPRPDDDGCQVVSGGTGSAWVLLLPAALILVLRRRR